MVAPGGIEPPIFSLEPSCLDPIWRRGRFEEYLIPKYLCPNSFVLIRKVNSVRVIPASPLKSIRDASLPIKIVGDAAMGRAGINLAIPNQLHRGSPTPRRIFTAGAC